MLARRLLAQSTASAGKTPTYIGGVWGDTGGANAGSVTINSDAGTQIGDLMIAFVSGAGSQFIQGDSGWTLLRYRLSEYSCGLFYKVATVAGAQSYNFASSGSPIKLGGYIQTWRNSAIDKTSETWTSSGTTPVSLPSIKPNESGFLIAFYGSDTNAVTYTTPTGMTARANQNTNLPSTASFFQTTTRRTDAGTKDSTPSKSANHLGVMLAIKGGMT